MEIDPIDPLKLYSNCIQSVQRIAKTVNTLEQTINQKIDAIETRLDLVFNMIKNIHEKIMKPESNIPNIKSKHKHQHPINYLLNRSSSLESISETHELNVNIKHISKSS